LTLLSRPHPHTHTPPPPPIFPQQLDITFRRDPSNFRPRINKYGSVKDQEQKKAGSYYYYDETSATADQATARDKARRELKMERDKEEAQMAADSGDVPAGKAAGGKKRNKKGRRSGDSSDED
jgi:hypothetical protein